MTKINNFLYLIHNLIKNLLTKSSHFDGRWLVGFSLLGYFSLLWAANWKLMRYHQFWRKLGVPATKDDFLDLRGVLSGFECTRLGYDVLLEPTFRTSPSNMKR